MKTLEEMDALRSKIFTDPDIPRDITVKYLGNSLWQWPACPPGNWFGQYMQGLHDFYPCMAAELRRLRSSPNALERAEKAEAELARLREGMRVVQSKLCPKSDEVSTILWDAHWARRALITELLEGEDVLPKVQR
jgi:hypothetical protein